MAQIQSFKRLAVEDFSEKDRELIQKLAYSINSFADDISRAFANNISISDNLNITSKEMTLTLNSKGVITGGSTLKTGLNHLCQGMTVIKVNNITNPTSYPTGTPFISFSENTTGQININNITNLPVGNSYKITVLLF